MTRDLFREVGELIRRDRLFDGVKTLCVGVSGGADSVCLLDVLTRLAPDFGLLLRAVHVHHGLRGAEADRDAEFVRDLCAGYGVPFHLVYADVRGHAEREKCSLEEAGRVLRYAAFRAEACDAVAVAHTLSDQVETALFRMARGTSLTGFSAMRTKTGDLLRPLLETPRADVERYLSERGLSFVTDSTNDTDAYTRNRIRRHAVPALEAVNAAFEVHTALLLDDVREADDYLTAEAEALLQTAKQADGYAANTLRTAAPVLRKKALRLLLTAHMTRMPERGDLERCLAVIDRGCGRTQLEGPLFFAVRKGVVTIRNSEFGIPN